jgi:hypothetical protein
LNGLIEQWGNTQSNSEYARVTLNISYQSTSSYKPFANSVRTNSDYGNLATVAKISNSIIELAQWNTVDSRRDNVNVDWYVLGY